MGQAGQALVEELLVEHKAILEQGRLASETSRGSEERVEILVQIAKDLENHAAKEEKRGYPIVAQMNQTQLKTIGETASKLGYRI
jgi:iron-sulfur cluster repair protein YtfE (RIC family)